MVKKVLAIGAVILLSLSLCADEFKLPEVARLSAIEILQSEVFSPEGGVSLPKAKNLIARYLAENGTKGDIYPHLKPAEITVKEAWENISTQLYRVDLAYAGLYGVAAVRDGKVLCVFDGMPTNSVFLADLDSDGYYEIYTNAFFGSGIVSLEIRGYNIALDAKYSLSMRMKKDLYLFVQGDALWVKEYPPVNKDSEPVSIGKLVLKDSGGGKELFVEHPDGFLR